MSDETIRHNYDETEALSQRFTTHAEHIQHSAGSHRRRAETRLGGSRVKDALAEAVATGSSRIMNVIKKAEQELHEHLRDVSHGLDEMSHNHRRNDRHIENALQRIHTRTHESEQRRAQRGPEAQGPLPGLKPHTVTVQWKPGMPKVQFARKALALKRLSRQGKLFKAPEPADRDGRINDDYKNALVRIILRKHADDPQLAQEARQRVLDMHPDRVHELQLGGRDSWENLNMLHAETNTGIGTSQIRRQIKGLPSGTPIRIKVKWW